MNIHGISWNDNDILSSRHKRFNRFNRSPIFGKQAEEISTFGEPGASAMATLAADLGILAKKDRPR